MIWRGSSFHHRGSKDPQGISPGWVQQGLSQAKQPAVVVKRVGKCVDILVHSIFCWDFLFSFFCVLQSWKSRWLPFKGNTHHCRAHKDLETQRGFFHSVELLRLARTVSEPYKLGNESFRLLFAQQWTWRQSPLDHSGILLKTGLGTGQHPS